MKNILPILADLANGMFAVVLVSYGIGHEIVWWYFLVGIVCAMSPDIDAIPELLMRGRVAASAEHPRDHRTFLHYPIVSIPLGLLAVWLFPYWGAIWFVAVMLHLVNDLYGTGWGLPLLYPFCTDHFKFFTRKVNLWPRLLRERNLFEGVTHEDIRVRFLVLWKQDELQALIQRYGIDKWIEVCYLRLTVVAIVEYSLFVLASALAVYSLLY